LLFLSCFPACSVELETQSASCLSGGALRSSRFRLANRQVPLSIPDRYWGPITEKIKFSIASERLVPP
jgi:hypothetical protein